MTDKDSAQKEKKVSAEFFIGLKPDIFFRWTTEIRKRQNPSSRMKDVVKSDNHLWKRLFGEALFSSLFLAHIPPAMIS